MTRSSSIAPTDGAAWLAEDYEQVNANQVRTALATLESLGDALDGEGRLADVGCGTGEVAEAMARLGYRVDASDVSPSMVSATLRRCAKLPVTARVAPAEELALEPGAYAVVHCSWVMHWVDRPAEVLAGFARALRPGGHLVLQWTGSQPADEGGGQYGVLHALAAREPWATLLAGTPLTMRNLPAEVVDDVLAAEGLETVTRERDVRHPTSVASGSGPSPADLAEVRRRVSLTGFATQGAALGERAHEFLDLALTEMVERGLTDPRDARVVARRPGGDR